MKFKLDNSYYPTLEVHTQSIYLQSVNWRWYPAIRIIASPKERNLVIVATRINNVNTPCEVHRTIPFNNQFAPGDLRKLVNNLLVNVPNNSFRMPNNDLGIKVLVASPNVISFFFETGYEINISPGEEDTYIKLFLTEFKVSNSGPIWTISKTSWL